MQVPPALEQATIEKIQRFFWNLTGSQEVNNQSNYLEQGKDGRLYQMGEKEQYVKCETYRYLTSRK